MNTLIAVVHAINRAGAMHWDFASAMFVQVAALVIILGLVELCLRRRVRPVVRYWLWALVILKLMLPVALRTPASLAYWVRSESQPSATIAIPAADLSPASQPIGNPQDFEARPLEEMAERALVNDSPSVAPPQRSEVPSIRSDVSPAAVAVPHALPHVDVHGWLFLAWCGGCLVLGGMVFRRAAKVRRLVHGATEAPREFGSPLKVACALVQLSSRRIGVKISEQVGCPAVCGFWRPTILIPERLVGRLDEEQLQLVLVHELEHWKRWDLQLNLLQTVLQVVYFYNPAVWIANFVLRRLREEVVDDAVLVALAAPVERYSHTLLDVAAHAARPLEMNVRLIGILESRKALANRIQRLATSPLPISARLGLWGCVAVGLIGMVLLPMRGRSAPTGDPTDQWADKPIARTAAQVEREDHGTREAKPPVLSGRIVDEEGNPVSDAYIHLISITTNIVQEVKTSRNGHYSVDRAWNPGAHRLMIFSDRCLGLTDYNACPQLSLDAAKPVVRNFTLQLACQVRLQTLDDEGRPIVGVGIFETGSNLNSHRRPTDRQGWATIGGLKPAEYVFAAYSKDFAIERVTVKLESPKTVVERKLVLKRGVAVKGLVVCSDGKPAAGWRVTALPSWWEFNGRPLGELIEADGSFVLPHIGPGAYDVTISIPGAGDAIETSTVLRNTELFDQRSRLVLRVEYPSSGSMGLIQGHFRFVGGRPTNDIWITADSLDGQSNHFHANARGRGNPLREASIFRLGPVPPGKYRLVFDSPEIETKQLDSVVAPVADLNVDIQVRGRIVLHGFLELPNAKASQPAGGFRIRIVKLKNLRGTNFLPNDKWVRVDNSQGEFNQDIPGPGIYVVEATADGFATVRSKPIDTDHLPPDGIHLTLEEGAGIAGTVVDEGGRPIDGAIVLSFAKAGGGLPLSLDQNVDGEIGVRAVAGHFRFDGLSPGTDTFQVMHPDYALTTVRNVEIPAHGQGTLAIVMKRGGTVCGHVHDERGRLMAGVRLEFRRNPGHFAGERYHDGFAAAVTDANGYYEVRHLPEELVHILRGPRGGNSLGVWHRSVTPASGKTRTVDFGAGTTISGRLFFNGAPRASTRLLLADESPNWDDFDATTTTDKDGAFVFTGVPRGRRYLYFSARQRRWGGDDWVHVRALDVNTAARNLGRIDHRVGTVTVKVVGRRDDDTIADLSSYDPSLFQIRRYAGAMRPRAKGDPYVFEDVAPGKYDFNLSILLGRERGASINHMFVVTPEEPNPTVTVEWPKGTASIRGTIDASMRELMGRYGGIALVSPNERWRGIVRVDESGRFELGEIPAGEYSVTTLRMRSGGALSVTLKEFRLAEGETKTLNFTKADFPQRELAKEVVQVSVFTPEGFQLPGFEIRLAGPPGQPPLPKPTRLQGSSKWFALPPGSYTFVASYLGAESAPQTVEVKPVLKDGAWIARDHVVNLTLAPIE
jgi:beta-lactamase regulating signal transducer with metallopeptidase domain